MDFNSIHLISSPQSIEDILYQHLKPQLQKRNTENSITSPEYTQNEYSYMMDNVFFPIDQDIVVEFSSFSELQVALQNMESMNPLLYHPQHVLCNTHASTEEDLVNLSSTNYSIPSSVRANVENSGFMDTLMFQAMQHWCCIGFKVAPINVDLIQNWRTAPRAIIYCIASISLVSLVNKNVQSQSSYAKQVSMAFYEQARKKMDDVFLDDMKPQIIQTYFCLSYTSNLLRLYDQQRTWSGLASISLQHLAKKKVEHIDQLTLGCWLRWYYIDAWMCLTLNRECLLPYDVPWLEPQKIEELSLNLPESDRQHYLYGFACLTRYMRRYIRALHSGSIFAVPSQKTPSHHYYEITQELVDWYKKLPHHKVNSSRLHLHICYHSMRLVVFYQFLQPHQPPPKDILIDCIETNLELLQTLQYLKETGCDQSTYHHMFFAIHNTAKRVYQYNIDIFGKYAEELLKINLWLLKSTQAYEYDVFKMRFYAEKIQEQFKRLNIQLNEERPKLPTTQIFVFKKDNSAIIKRNNKKRKKEEK